MEEIIMSRTIKKVLLTAVLLAVVLANGIYIAQEYTRSATYEKLITRMFSIGWGTEHTQIYDGSIYGHDYRILYYVEDGWMMRKVEW